MRVLGVDTSLRSTGFAVIDSAGPRIAPVAYGVIQTPAKAPHSACLARLHDGIREAIRSHAPAAAAIEGIFFSKNIRTAVLLGEARGVAIAACASAGLPVYEYAPRSVKQSLVGYGGAHKGQVSKMVMNILGLRETPPEDAADALAIAICHVQSKTSRLLKQTEPI
jgi:crossover junction endodeoxyribonuclease RuvC